jgi:cytochrome b pre-mRNA-processing protein 3
LAVIERSLAVEFPHGLIEGPSAAFDLRRGRTYFNRRDGTTCKRRKRGLDPVLKLSRPPSTARVAAERLHAAAVAQSRTPRLYAELGAPDTVEGRFEMLCLHVILLLDRMSDQTGVVAEVRQTLFDVFVSQLDGAMREMGVGDLAMAKRMRKLGAMFYGRLQAYSEAFAELPETGALAQVLVRTALVDLSVPAEPLALYVATAHAQLAAQGAAALVTGEPRWLEP